MKEDAEEIIVAIDYPQAYIYQTFSADKSAEADEWLDSQMAALPAEKRIAARAIKYRGKPGSFDLWAKNLTTKQASKIIEALRK